MVKGLLLQWTEVMTRTWMKDQLPPDLTRIFCPAGWLRLEWHWICGSSWPSRWSWGWNFGKSWAMGLDWPRQSLQRWPPSLVQSSFDWPAAQIQSQVWQQYLHVDSITNALLQATDIDHVEYRADLGSTKLEGKTFDKPVNFSQIKGSAMSNNALPMVCKVNLPAFLDELVQILWRQHPNLSDHQLWQEVLSGLLLWKNKHIPIAPKLTGTKTGALSSYLPTKQTGKKQGEYEKIKKSAHRLALCIVMQMRESVWLQIARQYGNCHRETGQSPSQNSNQNLLQFPQALIGNGHLTKMKMTKR